MNIKVRVVLFLSVFFFSCGEEKTAKKEADSVKVMKAEVKTSVDSLVTTAHKDSIGAVVLNKEAQKFKSTLLDDPSLMGMEQKETIIKYDLSSLFTQTPSNQIMGFIGDNYQRIYVKFLTVTKSTDQADLYLVTGKTKVKDNICNFKGTMKVVASRQFLENVLESDTLREGFILFEYLFYEDSTQKGTGVFQGIAASNYYINKHSQLYYDDLMSGADGFDNNQFVGEWKGYNATSLKRCNWGDHRIPNSGDFDRGAGEFYPAAEYRKNGWMDYHNAYFSESYDPKALERERAEWWK